MNAHEFQFFARQFRAGKVSLKDFTDKVFDRNNGADASADDAQKLLNKLKKRKPDSHKGDYGRVLVVGGSPGMAGAAALTGMAALRTGAGVVSVASDQRCVDTVASFHPAIMTIGLDLTSPQAAISSIEQCLSEQPFSCIALGPGLGRSNQSRSLARHLVSNSPLPLVIDADAITALAKSDDSNHEANEFFDFSECCNQPIVVTPHEGELLRLMPDPGNNRKIMEKFACQLADSEKNRVVLLKGHQTLVTDGKQQSVNRTGNAGMATAGSGDVLTGVIAALLGQGFSPFDAAVLGAHVHGHAGDLVAMEKSLISMVATDLIDALPSVLK